MSKYLKAIVAIAGAVLTSVLAAFPDNNTVQTVGPIIVSLLTALSVYLVPNATDPGDDPALDQTVIAAEGDPNSYDNNPDAA